MVLPARTVAARRATGGAGPTFTPRRALFRLAALVIAGIAACEGIESWRGESCECC
jgi:hypothetical protein